MAKGTGMPESAKTVISWALAVGIMAFVLLVMAIIFGNLSGNVGFTTGTLNYNNTQGIIGNYTESAVNTAQQFPTVGTILGIVVLLAILIGLLVFVITKLTGVTTGSDRSGFSG